MFLKFSKFTEGWYLFLHFEKEILSTHVFPPQFITAHKGRQDEIIS